MALLINEFTPKNIDEIFFHKGIYDMLEKMSHDDTIPHIIFHGPPGSGKKVMINIFLKMIYNDQINNLFVTHYNIPGSGNKVKKELVYNSKYHIVINPTGTNFDRYLVQEIVKKYANKRTLDLMENPNSKFRTIQISNLDKLSHNAQTSLRRMIETNSKTCRFITWCNKLSNIINPLKSRCICIRVPRPSKYQIMTYLLYISIIKKKNIDIKKLFEFAKYSECNIKTALWCFQFHIYDYEHRMNYDIALDRIINLILDYDIKKIDIIRDILFNIMITNYKGVQILKSIENKLITLNINDTCKANIIIKFAEIEYNIIRGRRDIIHFDSLITNIIYLMKKYS